MNEIAFLLAVIAMIFLLMFLGTALFLIVLERNTRDLDDLDIYYGEPMDLGDYYDDDWDEGTEGEERD